MPKIVDKGAYRQDLAEKAAAVFIEHGYHGLGMRGIAEALGVSKSALYHYFPSKQALFSACTEYITQVETVYGSREAAADPELALNALLSSLDGRFQGEMRLLLDYLHNKTPSEVARDPLMAISQQQYLLELSKVVGTEHAPQAIALMLGGLMLRTFDGRQTSLADIQIWIEALADK